MTKPRKLVFLLCCAVLGSAAFHHFTTRQEVIAAQTRTIQVAAASGPVGGMISVPIELASQGDENAIGFSLSFDAAVLGNPTAALGSGATGATLNSNASQAAQGRFGVALAFPANQKFTAGVQQIIVVTFSIAANAAFGATNINFGDQPVQREVADVTANALSTTYTGGAVTITKGFEADVSPRPDGDNNGTIAITDWVQVGKFVAGLDTAATGNEFQRADCAPRSALGDGRISIIDWAQAGRYAAALDPVTAAGGPTSATTGSLSMVGKRWPVINESLLNAFQPSSVVRAHLVPTTDHRLPATIPIAIEATGNENALGFSLIFNASHWRLLSVKAGRDADEGVLHINSTQADRGRIGIALAMPVGKAIARGERQLVVCEFAPIANRKGLPLMFDFGDFPVRREMADVEANRLIGNFSVESLESSTLFDRTSDAYKPEEVIAIFGTNLITDIASATDPELIARTATKITIIDSSGNQVLARLLYASPDSISCELPARIAEGTATVIVTNSNGDSFRALAEITRR